MPCGTACYIRPSPVGTRYKEAASGARIVWFRMSHKSMVVVVAPVAVALWLVCGASGATVPEAKDPWVSMVRCLDGDGAAACVQRRAVRALENLLPQDDEKEVELPKGVSPSIAKVIDRLGEMIASSVSQWYPEGDTQDPNSLDQARGHKKKVKKAIKKAILKLIIVGLLIKQKIKMLLMVAQTFLQFKFLLVAIVYVISNIVKIWLDVKSKHNPQKVIYYENAHHQHHYEPEHHDFEDHEHSGGGWGGLWGRSIVAPETTPSSNSAVRTHVYDSYPRSLDADKAQEIAYRGQRPRSGVTAVPA